MPAPRLRSQPDRGDPEDSGERDGQAHRGTERYAPALHRADDRRRGGTDRRADVVGEAGADARPAVGKRSFI
jgi:hypothetical protein